MAVDTSAIIEKLKQLEFSQAAFVHGLIGVAVFYIVLIFVMSFQSSGVIEAMQSELASDSVMIERMPVKEITSKAMPSGPRTIIPKHESLSETTALGPLPMIDKETGKTPFHAYRVHMQVDQEKPRIAIMIKDFGLSDIQSDKMLKVLPPHITYLLDAYSPNAQKWVNAAREKGSEIWLKAPFQTATYPNDDAGPHAIITKSSLRKNRNNMLWILSRATGYAGLAGETQLFQSERSPALMKTAEMAYARGLGFVEIADNSAPAILKVAADQGKPYAKSDFMFDLMTPEDLRKTEAYAQKLGEVMIALKSYPKNIDLLRSWVASLEQKGMQIVPASHLAEKNHAHATPAIRAEDLELQIIEGVDLRDIESPNARNTAKPIFQDIQDRDSIR